MAYSPRPVASMSHPDRWLAVLRIVVGLYFAKAFVTKLGIVMVGGVIPLPGATDRWISTMPKIVSKQAADNPILFYKQFLENTVLTHPKTFAHLTAIGETITGLGLTLGLFTGIAGDPVDVARPAGLSPRPVRPDDRVLRGPRRTDLGPRRPPVDRTSEIDLRPPAVLVRRTDGQTVGLAVTRA